MAGPVILTKDDDIDVVGIFVALRRKWWLILLVTLLAGAAFLFILSLISPRYESEARILVRDGETTFTRATNDVSRSQSNPRFDQQAVGSEVEVIGSDKLILEVIDDLQLTSLGEFDGENEYPEVRNKVLELAGREELIKKAKPTPVEITKRNRALRIIKQRLNVYAIDKSRVIVVHFWAKDAELAQTFVSTLTNKYIKLKKMASVTDSNNAAGWLDPKITELEKDVLDTESAVAEFRANSDILRTDNNALLATQQLTQVSTELTRLKAERSSAQAKVASIRAALKEGSSLDVIPEVIESPLIQRLREREVELRAQISELSTTLLPNHPRMKALTSQLSDFESQIRTATKNIVKSLENNVNLTKNSEQDLEREIVRLKSEAARVDEKLVGLRALEREAEAAKSLLREYKSRSLEVKSRSGLSQVDAEIISPATLADEPYFPKIIPFTIAGMVASALLTMLAVITGSLLSVVSSEKKFHSASLEEPGFDDENKRNTETQAGASKRGEKKKSTNRFKVPFLHKYAREERIQDVRSEATEKVPTQSFGQNTNNVDEETPFAIHHAVNVLAKHEQARVAVVSPSGDWGASSTWLLARGLADKGRSVLLIDLSGGDICSKKMLGSDDLPGIFNLIDGSVGVDSVFHRDRESAVDVVPSGTLFSGNLDVDSDLLYDLMDALAEPYEFCIIECGDADIEDLDLVLDDETIVAISCIKAHMSDVEMLETDLFSLGVETTFRLSPDREDVEHRQTEPA